jgi:hypothetical protein
MKSIIVSRRATYILRADEDENAVVVLRLTMIRPPACGDPQL